MKKTKIWEGKQRFGLGPNQEKLQAILEYKNYKKITKKELIEIIKKYNISANPNYLIKSMLLKKRLISFKRGNYFIIPIKSIDKLVGISELEFINYFLESEYYIGLFNAYYHHGFTGQIPNKLFVFNTKFSGNKVILNFNIKFFKIKKGKLFGIEKKYPYSDIERTILDSLDYSNYLGGLDKVLDEIKEVSFDKNKLAKYAIRYKSIKIIKLVGILTNNKKLFNFVKQKKALSYYTTIRNTKLNLIDKKWKIRLI